MSKRIINKLRHKELVADIARLRAAETTGKFGDGGGLSLVVTSAGRARFVHKFQWRGRTAERWLPGDFPDDLSLAEARDLRDADRKLLRAGDNPITAAKAEAEAARGVPTFAEYARSHVQFLAPGKPKGRAAWLRQMTGDDTDGVTVGLLATMAIDDIAMEHVKSVIAPLWVSNAPTAKELCARIRRVLDHRQTNARPDDERRNPADFARIERAIGKRFQHKHKGRASLAYEAVPAFLAALRGRPQLSARVLEWTILNGCRVNEATGAQWGEVDLKARTWTIPAERMKSQDDSEGEPHVIPLSRAALSVLRRALPPHQEPEPADLIFPNRKGRPFNHKCVLEHVKAVTGGGSETTHGFRASLMAWGTAIPHRKREPFSRDLMNVCLAHELGDEVSQAYLRDRWLARRRVVMREWSRFCDPPTVPVVIPFRRAA
jgi:integrase